MPGGGGIGLPLCERGGPGGGGIGLPLADRGGAVGAGEPALAVGGLAAAAGALAARGRRAGRRGGALTAGALGGGRTGSRRAAAAGAGGAWLTEGLPVAAQEAPTGRARSGGRARAGAGAVADRGLACRRGKWLILGLARLERAAAHDSMLGCGHLDRRGRRGTATSGGAGGLDRRRRLRVVTTGAGSTTGAGGTSGSATATAAGSSALAAAFFVVLPRPSPAWLPRAARRGSRPSRSALRRTRSACASSMLEEWLLTPIPSATAEIECLLVGQPELSWRARGRGSLRARVHSAFRCGLGEISSRARQPIGLSARWPFSHVRADFRPSLEQRRR